MTGARSKSLENPAPHDSLARQIAITAKHTRQWADGVFAEHRASLVTWIVLKHALHADPPGFSQRELAEDISIGGPALVRHLDRLEQDGLVERQPDPTDRRVTRVSITDKGRRRHADLTVIATRIDVDLRSLLSDREVRTLFIALARIEHHLASQSRSEIA
jgi:MarR family transcriptional regulator for hemolysin